MNMRKRLAVFALAGLVFVTSMGAAGTLFVEKVLAASCSTPPVFFNRACFRGYYKNNLDVYGLDVRLGGIPSSVNYISEFRNMVESDLNSSNAQRKTGAQFVIHTMLGLPSGTTKSVSSTQLNDWRDRLQGFSNISENGSRSTGTSGYIDWFVSWHIPCGTPNTYYQDDQDDVAPYVNSTTNSNCGTSSFMDSFIYFRNTSGTLLYRLRRDCMNPVGTMNALPDTPDFSMTGQTTVNGGTSAQVLPGDTVQFRHSLRNGGPNSTSPFTIDWRTLNQNNSTVSSGNAGTFSNNQTKTMGAEDYVVPANATPGSQICRRIRFEPRNFDEEVGFSTQRCATVQYDYDLEPRINVTITDTDGQDVTADGVAEAGYTIEFTYSVNNSGLTQSESVTCTYRQDAHTGYDESAPTQVFVPAGASCPPDTVFSRNSTTQVAVESITGGAVAINTTICRSLTIAPASESGGSETIQSCIPVVAKPYARVYGGDVSVGNDFDDGTGVCGLNDEAAVVGWNRRTAGDYAGAGAQYAVYALNVIEDFASAQSTTGNGAPAPAGLSFANSTNVDAANGDYGGYYGSAPCIRDYYGDRPDSGTTALGGTVNVTNLDSGTYTRDGSLTLVQGSGTAMEVNPGEEIVIFVDGDVFIDSSVDYPGSWNVANMPSFRLIVEGNIYVSQYVDRLSGLYVAQGDGSTSGIVHTCAATAAALALDGNLYDTCSTNFDGKLTVNGAMIGHEIRLLRTTGSLSQSERGDNPPAGGEVGEVFNFDPALWINQPSTSSTDNGEYDSVISLPPIL